MANGLIGWRQHDCINREQRSDLVLFCRGELKVNNPLKRAQLIQWRNQLCITSLTAEPVAFFGNGAYYNTANAAIKDGAEGITPLYDAPPVPEIKLPEVKCYAEPHTQYSEGVVDGYNRCLAGIKRLKGLGE